MWQVQALDSSVDAPVKSDLPTLLLSGRFDPITPPPYAEQVAANLPNSVSLVFPNGGHGQMVTNDCADTIIRDFLNAPTQRPATACLDEISGLDFLTSRTVIEMPSLFGALRLDGTSLVMWLLLHWTRLMTVMKRAADQPMGWVGSAVMLNARLKPGVNLLHVVAMTRSLGERLSAEGEDPERYRWTDSGGSCVTVTLQAGRVTAWELHRPPPEV